MVRWTVVALVAAVMWGIVGWVGAHMGGPDLSLRTAAAGEVPGPLVPSWLRLVPSAPAGEGNWSVELSLREAPHPGAPSAGVLRATFDPTAGFTTEWIPPGRGGAAVPFTPDLHDPDWGYGPWHHQTVLEARPPWYLLPADPFPAPVWVEGSALGMDPLLPIEPGMILDSPQGSVVVEEVSAVELRVRPEQPGDLWCSDGEAPPLRPAEPWSLAGRELRDANRHLRVRIRYTRGC